MQAELAAAIELAKADAHRDQIFPRNVDGAQHYGLALGCECQYINARDTPHVVHLLLLESEAIVAVGTLNQQLDVGADAIDSFKDSTGNLNHKLFLQLLEELLRFFFGQGSHCQPWMCEEERTSQTRRQ
jgi:hypothetical protein